MILPPLYKYLDVLGAKLTLGNRTFKHAKPSDFNDTEDLTVQSLFEEDINEALKIISANFTDALIENLDKEITCSSPMKEKVKLLQATFRANPAAAEIVKREKAKAVVDVLDLVSYRKMAEAGIAEINRYMQGYRVLCVSTHKDSERMWSEYAEKYKGISLRIQPNLAKDSKFGLFRPVDYREKRLPLYERTLEFTPGVFFGDQDLRIKESIERIIYTKTLDWQHEGEYRLAIPIRENEPPWNTLPYHSEEVTEMYLGCEMERVDMDELVDKARIVNPDIAIFRTKRDSNKSLCFEPF